MKKIVLFICLLIASVSLFGKTSKEINAEICEVIIKGWNLDSALDAQNPPMSELEKDSYIFFRQENYPEMSKLTSSRMISSISVMGISQRETKKDLPKWQQVVILIFIFLTPFVLVLKDTNKPRRKKPL